MYRNNNLDDLIINQGYMSQRTKSPRRVNGLNIPQSQFYDHNNEMYGNVNKLNSNRDMSPNKLINKNKPLLMNTSNVPTNRIPMVNNNFPNFQQKSQNGFMETQQTYQTNMFEQQKLQNMQGQNGNWKNVKSPRSPQMDNQNFIMPQNNGAKLCYNHNGKKAEYMAETDGEVIYYCATCAAKLAANNFQVVKLPTSTLTRPTQQHFPPTTHRPKLIPKRRQIPSIPQYKSNPVYQSVVQFLKEIFTVEQYHYENYEQLESLQSHYDQQLSMVEEFYNELLSILDKMKNDHLEDLEQEKKKSLQMRDIYLNEIYENIDTIDQIVIDLDQNFQICVNKITHEDIQFFNDALQKNRNSVRFFANQIENQRDNLKDVTEYKEEKLIAMVPQFEKALQQLWLDPKPQPQKQVFMKQPPKPSYQQQPLHFNQPNSSNIPTTNARPQANNTQQQQKLNVLQMHQQNIPKSGLTRQFQGKGACRQIFQDDEQENIAQQVSPKFKNI